MSSFLQKLKSGAVSVNNNAPPNNAGVVVRRVEKHFLSEPAEAIGLTLSEDAEVLGVAPNSLAAAANIPLHYMVFEVNDDFVENSSQFVESANRTLNLVIKLQSVSAMSELIARILQEEEELSSGVEVRNRLNFDELLRTTPRYNFLSSKHPLFRRYTKRLMERREATALIKRRIQEAEEHQKREIRERIQKELEAAKAEEKKAQEEAALNRANASAAEGNSDEPFIRVFEDESAFQRAPSPHEEPPQPAEVVTPENTHEEASSPTPEPENAPEAAVEEPSIPQSTPEPQVAPLSTRELLALVGIVPMATETAAPISSPPPPAQNDVQYAILPSEEYTLSSGEKVISTLKSRNGPLPLPPPGRPPRMSKAARALLNPPEKPKEEPKAVAAPLKPTAPPPAGASRENTGRGAQNSSLNESRTKQSRSERKRSRSPRKRHDRHRSRRRTHSKERDRSKKHRRGRSRDRDRARRTRDRHGRH